MPITRVRVAIGKGETILQIETGGRSSSQIRDLISQQMAAWGVSQWNIGYATSEAAADSIALEKFTRERRSFVANQRPKRKHFNKYPHKH